MLYRAICTCLVLLAAASSWAQPAPKEPLSVLLVGNSQIYFNQGVGSMMEALAASDSSRRALDATELTLPGGTLKRVWDYYQGMERLPTERFDVVVLQDTLGSYVVEKDIADQFRQYAGTIDRWFKARGSSRMVLYMEPTYTPPRNAELSPVERDAINREVAGELHADVAPIDVAWQRAWKERPSLNLFAPDGEHPNKAGSYLIACVLYATVTRSSPVGLSYIARGVIGFGDDLREEDAAFIQQIAWQTCTEYEPAHVSR